LFPNNLDVNRQKPTPTKENKFEKKSGNKKDKKKGSGKRENTQRFTALSLLCL
jgi:hypothetical protein